MRARSVRILLFGTCALLLQQLSIPYEFTMLGMHSGTASLVHLQSGFLLALAMLERERVVVAGCFVLVGLGWLVRARLQGFGIETLAVGVVMLAVAYAWTLACAHWLGWPRTGTEVRVAPGDVLKFAGVGLLLFPLGHVVFNMVGNVVFGDYALGQIGASLVQVYFAKQFGVAVVSLPLLVAWTERGRPAPAGAARSPWILVLAACLGVSVWLSGWVKAGIGDPASLVVMDYRLVLVAIVGWCMLNLRMSVAMVLFALLLFLMAQSLASAAQQNGTILGIANLAHLGVEVGILLVGLLYYSLQARERARLQARVHEDAQRDSITGLPNYNALREQLEARPGGSGEIGYLLLDQADAVAVGFGLQAQATAMNTVAARLAQSMRAYYLGTGQFALLPDEGEASERAWAATLASVERMEHKVGDRRVRMTPYLGVVAFGGSGHGDIEYALLSASNLAYEARRRSEVKPLHADVAHSTLRHEGQRRLQDAADAIASLRAGRLSLHFQTICAIEEPHESPSIRGEVLCRLLDERGALIPPDRFVDSIEASRGGPELDLAVINELFRELRLHPAAIARFDSISVNLTGQSLSSDGFRARLEDVLARAPVKLSKLCFEITETAAIANADSARQLLQSLRERGCRIAIDDFGTGMQSFARLRDLPFDIIKIDGSFVRNMLQDRRDFEVVQASVAVARAFGAETVAEFVESQALVECLRGVGVRWGQGYVFARPRPLRDMLAEAS